MIFTSFTFVIFFAAVYGLLLAVRNDIARRAILLAASAFFYGFWNVGYLLLIAFVILGSWLCGTAVIRAQTISAKRFSLTIGVAFSLGLLAFFKYSGFAATTAANVFGLPVPSLVYNIVLPVGISFYTFHAISYCVDAYRGLIKDPPGLRNYALYISFFPQLIAGPITRAHQFLPQLERPITLTFAGFRSGIRLFLIGAFQKLLIADVVGPFADQVFQSPDLYSGVTDWLAVLAYACQIFGDFAGYSLMAIGLAQILGYALPENFRMPYLARSAVDFWRRWNITLSFFLRDYLYIPLGGNRRGFLRAQFNVMVTMFLGGLWHGASWNFVLWGIIHGTAIVVNHTWERTGIADKLPRAIWAPLAWFMTLLLVMLAWVPFRAPSFDIMSAMFRALFTLSPGIVWYHTPTCIVLTAVALWHAAHRMSIRSRVLAVLGDRWMYTVEMTTMITLLAMFAPLNVTPFIYFQF